MTNTVLSWLRGYPGLENLRPEALDMYPGSTGLFCKGLTLLRRNTDILGREFRRQRLDFLLLRHCTGDSGAQWLLDFTPWAHSTAPVLGQDGVFSCGKGRLIRADDQGVSRYELQLTFEFTQEV